MSRTDGSGAMSAPFCAPCDPPTLRGGAPLSALAAPLVAWYRAHARPLPWRAAPINPYHVWLSEVMLQQTRIEAVKPYYARFLREVPDIPTLAALPDERLMKLWEGLGYYSRARNLKRAAIAAVEHYGGTLPADHAALLTLPGIGEYTAGAIASIAFGLPEVAVDGNVLRVLTRLTADPEDILLPQTKKRITAALRQVYLEVESTLCDTRPPQSTASPQVFSALTQGLMELGEVVCLANRAPQCGDCPLADLCRVRESGEWDRIPYRAKRKARTVVRKLVLLLCDEAGGFALRRRPSEGLLADLWELPQLDLPAGAPLDESSLDALGRAFCREMGLLPAESTAAPAARHVFTHLEWEMQGRYFNVARTAATSSALTFASPAEFKERYALPSAFRTYLRVIMGERD